jgi:malate synthase
MVDIAGATITASADGFDDVLTDDAMRLLVDLHRRFDQRRHELLDARARRRARLAETGTLSFLAETTDVRSDAGWRVAPAPADLLDRRVEITGPTDAKMLINAWNSGARVHLADFEDANTPMWTNMVEGQRNLALANRRQLRFDSPDGRHYELAERTAVPVVRPRGWHLPEKHVLVAGTPVSGALFDFALYFAHNADHLVSIGSAPYFYLPKMESYLEARLWNDVFVAAQEALGLPPGTIRATVLIETINAAFEMEEILFELRDHASGLNAGRWDYLFSIIKNFRDQGAAFVLPDRGSITMTVPFMRAYTELLVATCHRRGAFAIGGMAAYIPNRRDAEVNDTAISRVRADKERESNDGFDGTWVAHPDLVPVAMAVFDGLLGARPNQLERQRPDVHVDAAALLDVAATPGRVTMAGLRNNTSVAIRYLMSWLGGSGAAAIDNLMEDVATAEIARSQIWQWIANGTLLDDGQLVTRDLVVAIADNEIAKLGVELASDLADRVAGARRVFDEVALGAEYVDFLTAPAYELLP